MDFPFGGQKSGVWKRGYSDKTLNQQTFGKFVIWETLQI